MTTQSQQIFSFTASLSLPAPPASRPPGNANLPFYLELRSQAAAMMCRHSVTKSQRHSVTVSQFQESIKKHSL